MKICPFCRLSKEEKIIFETKNFVLVKSKTPIIDNHYLLILKSHVREEREISSQYWPEYQMACKKAYNFLSKKTGKKPLIFINPPQMQSIPHFHRHYVTGVFGVHGVTQALKTYLVKSCFKKQKIL